MIGFALWVSKKIDHFLSHDIITSFVYVDYNLSPLDYVGTTTLHPINISPLDLYPLTN